MRSRQLKIDGIETNVWAKPLVKNEEGNVLNPDAYQVWKPNPLEGRPVKPEQFKAKLAELSQNL